MVTEAGMVTPHLVWRPAHWTLRAMLRAIALLDVESQAELTIWRDHAHKTVTVTPIEAQYGITGHRGDGARRDGGDEATRL